MDWQVQVQRGHLEFKQIYIWQAAQCFFQCMLNFSFNLQSDTYFTEHWAWISCGNKHCFSSASYNNNRAYMGRRQWHITHTGFLLSLTWITNIEALGATSTSTVSFWHPKSNCTVGFYSLEIMIRNTSW